MLIEIDVYLKVKDDEKDRKRRVPHFATADKRSHSVETHVQRILERKMPFINAVSSHLVLTLSLASGPPSLASTTQGLFIGAVRKSPT